MDASFTSANNAWTALVSSVPVELWEKIFNNLECKDIKSVRLSCRKWSIISPPASPFKPFFTFRADRFDLERFDRVFKSYPQFSQAVTALRFETSAMDFQALAKNLGFEFMQTHNRELRKMKEGKPHDWDRLQREKDAAISEYATWRNYFDNSHQDYTDEHRLAIVFSQVYRLDRISISRKDLSWKSGHKLLSAWVANDNQRHHQIIEDEYEALISALRHSGHYIKYFSHDQLPVKCVVSQPRSFRHTFIFQKLTTLHLTFDAT